MKAYIGNLPYAMQETDLQELVSVCGEYESVEIIRDKISGRSKGFGFVTMKDKEGMEALIGSLNNKEIGNRIISACPAFEDIKDKIKFYENEKCPSCGNTKDVLCGYGEVKICRYCASMYIKAFNKRFKASLS